MIPKILHYVWVGNKKNKVAEYAISSWKKTLPKDWKIIEWNEKNIPMDLPFIKYWYEKKKYAFVSDYVRLWAVNKYGGMYLDTDVILQKDIPSKWTTSQFSLARTTINRYGLAIFLGSKDNDILKQILKIQDLPLYRKGKNHELLYNTLLSFVLNKKYGKSKCDDKMLGKKVFVISHREAQLDFEDGRNVAKHLFSGSWTKTSSGDKIVEGKFYHLEVKLYKGNIFAKVKVFFCFLNNRFRYQWLKTTNKDFRVLIKELINLI